MTFEQFAVAVRDWQSRLTPAQARAEVARQLASGEGVEGLRRGISIEAVLVMVRMGLGPGMCPVGVRASEPVPAPEPKPAEFVEHVPDSKVEVLEPAPEPPPRASKAAKRHYVRKFGTRGRPSKRAQALVREQLASGPKRGEEARRYFVLERLKSQAARKYAWIDTRLQDATNQHLNKTDRSATEPRRRAGNHGRGATSGTRVDHRRGRARCSHQEGAVVAAALTRADIESPWSDSMTAWRITGSVILVFCSLFSMYSFGSHAAGEPLATSAAIIAVVVGVGQWVWSKGVVWLIAGSIVLIPRRRVVDVFLGQYGRDGVRQPERDGRHLSEGSHPVGSARASSRSLLASVSSSGDKPPRYPNAR